MFDMSVVISAYNRCESLRDTLESLVDQRVNQDLHYEIIVVDNNSKDETRTVVEGIALKSKRPVRYLFEPIQGKSYAMNCGTRAALGKFVAYCDDDVVADQDWVQNLCEAFLAYDADTVGGPVRPLWFKKPPEWLESPEKQFGPLAILDRGNKPIIAGETERVGGNFLLGSNIAIRSSVLREVGLFRTDLGRAAGNLAGGEDSEMVRRLLERGKRLVYVPTAIVNHKVPAERMTLAYLRRWNFWMARSNVRMSTFRHVTFAVLLLECLKSMGVAFSYYAIGARVKAIGAEINFWWRLGMLTEMLSRKGDIDHANR